MRWKWDRFLVSSPVTIFLCILPLASPSQKPQMDDFIICKNIYIYYCLTFFLQFSFTAIFEMKFCRTSISMAIRIYMLRAYVYARQMLMLLCDRIAGLAMFLEDQGELHYSCIWHKIDISPLRDGLLAQAF